VSARTLPTIWGLTYGQRNRTKCVWCALPLGDDAVPAGIAVGYWGAHNRSVPVDSCPPCASVPSAAPPTAGPPVIRICADCGRLIEDGEEVTSHSPDRPTTASPTIYRHAPSCPDPNDWSDPVRAEPSARR